MDLLKPGQPPWEYPPHGDLQNAIVGFSNWRSGSKFCVVDVSFGVVAVVLVSVDDSVWDFIQNV